MRKTNKTLHTDIVTALAKSMFPSLYLEFGIRNGATFRQVFPYCKKAVGVDLADVPTDIASKCYKLSTKAFCETILPDLGEVDLVFIDADHNFESVKMDVFSVLPYMTKYGLVVLHDTFPESKYYLQKSQCHNSYLAADYFSNSPNLEVLTIPVPPGITLVRKYSVGMPWDV